MTSIIQLKNSNDISKKYFTDAVKLYIEIFREPPYEEEFKMEDVEQDFKNYILNGCFLLAIIEDEVVGFMCSSVGLDHINSDIELQITYSGIDYKKDIYISELGVSKHHRGKKIAKHLIDNFMELHPTQNMFLRTGVNNNDHVIRLYEKYDFVITDVREFVVNKRANGNEEKDERLYMYKKQHLNIHEHKSQDGYCSGAEYLYGTKHEYEKDTRKDDGYKSGSEYLY